MKKWKKTGCAVVLAILAIVLICIAAIHNQIESVNSIKKVADGFYTMNYCADYKLNKLLAQGISSEKELEQFVSDNIFFGCSVSGNESYYGGGCTAFSVMTPGGEYISGKNFDYDPTESLLVYTHPKNGYASYSMVDLDIMGVGKNNDVASDSLIGKITMLAAPYLACEGMNEKGIFIGIEELETEAIHQDNGKTDLLLFLAVRAMLDNCATVDECIVLLENYDIHTQFGTPFHLLISDTSGKSVVVEWIDNQMKVLAHNYCTNFQLSEGKDYWVGIGQDRYETVEEKLTETANVLTSEDAMGLLQDTRIEWNGEWDTEWSVVYNQSDFSVNVCIGMDYEHVYCISIDYFK